MESRLGREIPTGEDGSMSRNGMGFAVSRFGIVTRFFAVKKRSAAGALLSRCRCLSAKLPTAQFVPTGELVVPIGGARFSFDELQCACILLRVASETGRSSSQHCYILFDLLARPGNHI